MISFASVNAVLFTPALPDMTAFLHITESSAQTLITCYLIGYTFGQLIYGPITNRFGRRNALYTGISLAIISSVLCIVGGSYTNFTLIWIGRFFMALGSGVGLKMVFTILNETYEPKEAGKKLSYLMTVYAITPGIGVMIGGLLTQNFGWLSTFYANLIYGVLLFLLVTKIPESKMVYDHDALRLNKIIHSYRSQFLNPSLIAGGLLMGCVTCFVYLFAALAPFIAITMMQMEPAKYGIANLLPPIGLVLGSFLSAKLITKYDSYKIISTGIVIATFASLSLLTLLYYGFSPFYSLFLPSLFCYLGIALILANAATIGLSKTSDKSHGSAVINFINMGFAASIILSINNVPLHWFLLPLMYISLCVAMVFIYYVLTSYKMEKVMS